MSSIFIVLYFALTEVRRKELDMISNVFFSALIALLVIQQVLADPELCPDPEDAYVLFQDNSISSLKNDYPY